MKPVKTKAASEWLGVSQTTIKRWAYHFSSSFPKDRFGHYVFTEHELKLLQGIKARIEGGASLEQIILPSIELDAIMDPTAIPSSSEVETAAAVDMELAKAMQEETAAVTEAELAAAEQVEHSAQAAAEPPKSYKTKSSPAISLDELQLRLQEVERSLQQKADEVVSAQVLQHRKELDELRQTVAQLAAAVENMSSPAPKSFSLPHYEYPETIEAQPPRTKKRRFLIF